LSPLTPNVEFPPLFPFEFPLTAFPPAPIVTGIVPPIGTVLIFNQHSTSCPDPPPPDPLCDHECPDPPEPPPPTRISLITGPESAGLVQLPEEYILVSLGRYMELTPPAAIASAVIPAFKPFVIA
jgi:hypothetical protein